MRKLLRGERNASFGVALGLFALLCLLGGSLGLTLYSMEQADKFNATVYERCIARTTIDRALNDSVKADVTFYQQLLDVADSVPAQADQATQTLLDEQRRIIQQALESKKRAAAAGVVGNCDQYRR